MNYNIKVIENFLEEQDILDLNSINFSSAPTNGIATFHNEIDKFNQMKTNKGENEIIKNFHLKYHDKAMNILKEINPEKVYLYDYSMISIVKTGKNFKFPIHDDTPEKLLSGVIYLSPNKNVGTSFYSTKTANSKQTVEWKENLGVFFSRKERETWHSYEGNGNDERKVLVYNLATKRVKEAFKIEKKNFYYGMLRWKLNPLIYKFFKTII